jgi:predicted ATPase
MLGRASELSLLEGAWRRAVDERRPSLVTIFGPAGIGKSRLTAEFSDVASSEGVRVVKGRSLPYGEVTPYGVFGSQLKNVAGIFDTDPPEAVREKLEGLVGSIVDGEDPAELASHLALLIGLEGDGEVADRQTIFYSARRFIEALAAERPTVLVFEDIHVASPSMLDLLELIASRVRDVPLLLLTLARPELLSVRPSWGGGLPAYTALQLEPLAVEHSRELASLLLAAAGADADPARTLAGSGEGNPLFIEEIVASVTERTDSSGELPTSIRSIISARLDSLPPPEREALLDAAVMGKVFWSGALQRMKGGDGVVQLDVLDALEGRDLIRRDPVSRLQGDQQFVFKHQLIREVAYATLPRALRRERHRAVAAFLEESVGESGEVVPALAHHWREAGDGERAAEYFLRAGDQAGRGWAKYEAGEFYGEALALLPEEEVERRRDVTRRRALALAAVMHVTDAQLRSRRAAPQQAES